MRWRRVAVRHAGAQSRSAGRLCAVADRGHSNLRRGCAGSQVSLWSPAQVAGALLHGAVGNLQRCARSGCNRWNQSIFCTRGGLGRRRSVNRHLGCGSRPGASGSAARGAEREEGGRHNSRCECERFFFVALHTWHRNWHTMTGHCAATYPHAPHSAQASGSHATTDSSEARVHNPQSDSREHPHASEDPPIDRPPDRATARTCAESPHGRISSHPHNRTPAGRCSASDVFAP